MKNCNFSRSPIYPMIPRTMLVTQNSARSERGGLALFEATSGFGIWRTGGRCIMTATIMPANNSAIQIQICGTVAPSGLAPLGLARASPRPFQRVAASKNGERQNDRYSELGWIIGE